MRGGFLSSFSVPGARTARYFEPNWDTGHAVTPPVSAVGMLELISVPVRLVAEGGAGREVPQKRPASNSWSAVKGTPNESCIRMASCVPIVIDCEQLLKSFVPK